MGKPTEEEVKRYVEQHWADYESLHSDPIAWDEELTDRMETGVISSGCSCCGSQPNWKQKEKLSQFGEWLRQTRQRTGFRSLKQVVEAEKKELEPGRSQLLSRSMLSVIERGKVNSLKPEVLWVLARLCRVPYEEVVRRWVLARFAVNFSEAKPS
ncbi:MAG: helix-turn-helix domain-containing protein [Candidatus Andersenbacteria bacterium]|nr:helix-turn-helix domain-containing protein [Candidatus Andersenbacteria bacterium]